MTSASKERRVIQGAGVPAGGESSHKGDRQVFANRWVARRMRDGKRALRRWRQRQRDRERTLRNERRCRVESLESRQMLSVNVVQPMGELEASEDGPADVIDLRQVFQSDLDQTLSYELIDPVDDRLVHASIDEWALRLEYVPEQSGDAEIAVRAAGDLDDLSAIDTLTLHVAPVNDWPQLVDGLPELSLHEGDSAVIDLRSHFHDLEQGSGSLNYTVAPFEVGYPGNPIASVAVEDGQLTLQTSNNGFGYAKYAIRAEDDQGAQVATTLSVYVDPVNDAPRAAQMPNRFHQGSDYSGARLVAIDLWHQSFYDGMMSRYFWDPEDECFLDYSVTVDDSDVFAVEPYVDDNDFLLYKPTQVPDFQGSAVVTIHATDREGLEARLPDGSLPTFTVIVDNTTWLSGGSSSGDSADDGAGAGSLSADDPLASADDPQASSSDPLDLPQQDDGSLPGDSPLSDAASDAYTDLFAARDDFWWPDLPHEPGMFPPPDLIGAIGELPWPGIDDPREGDDRIDPVPPWPNPSYPPLPGPQPPPAPVPEPKPPTDLPILPPDDPVPVPDPDEEHDPDDLPEDPGDLPEDPVVPDPPPDPLPPADPPADDPGTGDPPADPAEAVTFDLDVLHHRVPDALEHGAGALVALNDDFDEWNLATDTISVGPNQRPVTVLRRLRDNQPDRIPDQGRQHLVAAQWDIVWTHDADGLVWDTGMDGELRGAIVTSNVSGSVEFQTPDNARLWVPAWALYGTDAFVGDYVTWEPQARWIPVRDGEVYRLDHRPTGLAIITPTRAIPILIEGVELGSDEIVATFVANDASQTLDDKVSIHVTAIDLDVDMDNDNALDEPDRSMAEDELEDVYRITGKRLPVNSDDQDRDGIADFLDGFDLDHLADDSPGVSDLDNAIDSGDRLGFVPLVIEIPAPIDPAIALLRFTYSGSDPAAATISADGDRQPAPGGLRLWSADESLPRSARSVDDAQPGHFIAPLSQADAGHAYTVSQLTGGEAVSQFTVYIEGVRAGRYAISIEVDPDGVPATVEDPTGALVPEYPDLFAGFVMHDSVQITVESEVVVSAVNALGTESDATEPVDPATFMVSRGDADVAGDLDVYFRVVSGDQPSGAIGPVENPSRADFDVVDSRESTIGLADDPVTRIGSVRIPDGESNATIHIQARDDRETEWDEDVRIELISWDDYRGLHDQLSVVTPNDGLPASYNAWSWWEPRSFYRSQVDESGLPVADAAAVTLFDNDHVDTHSLELTDRESMDLSSELIEYGAFQVDVYGGQARYKLPGDLPQYREDDGLRSIIEAQIRLPANVADASSLSGSCTLGGLSGPVLTVDESGLTEYLAPNADRELRLVFPGPEDVSASLATGHYDHDIRLTAEIDGQSYTRTLSGSTNIVNRVDPALGSAEWGGGWTLDELDRLVPSDGSHAGGTGQSVSRLAPLGVATESGLAVVRGDNSVSWYRAMAEQPAHILEVDDDTAVDLSDPQWWVGTTTTDGRVYRTSSAGLREEAEDVTWTFQDVDPGRMVQVFAQWEPRQVNASNASYHVSATPVSGSANTLLVDQRYVPGEFEWDGRLWHSLGFFTVDAEGDPLSVRLSTQLDDTTFVDGVVSAGAVMIIDDWELLNPDRAFSELEWSPDTGRAELTTKTRNVYHFDAATGVLTESIDRNENRTQYSYTDADQDGREDELTRIMSQGGLETTIEYESGSVRKITDFAGRETEWIVADNLVTQVTLPDPGFDMQQPVYGFEYEGTVPRVAAITDPGGHITSIERHENSSRVAVVTNPDGNQWSLQSMLNDGLDGTLKRPAAGNPTIESGAGLAEPWATWTDTRGSVWQYQTDPFGLVTAKSQPAIGGTLDHDAWRWQRDARGLPTRITAPAGGGGDTPLPAISTWHEYDALGNLLRTSYADETLEEWTYDVHSSQVESYRDRQGRLITYLLGANDNVVGTIEWEQRYADTPHRRTTYSYTDSPQSIEDVPGGLVATTVVAAGTPDAVTTVTQYYESGPAIGLAASVHDAYGVLDPDTAAIVHFRYDDRRCLVEVIDEGGRSTYFEYDRLDRLHTQTDPSPGTGDHAAGVTTYRYDSLGNVIAVTDAQGTTVRNQYDAMGRLVSRTLPPPGGDAATDQHTATTAYAYDGEGNLLAQWDALGNQTSYTYNARNQPVSIIEPLPEIGATSPPPGASVVVPVTVFTYDAWGNVLTKRDPVGAETSYRYDMFQQLTRTVQAPAVPGQTDGLVEQFVYSAAGQLIEQWASGADGWRVTRYEYDDLGRLRREQQPADQEGRHPEVIYDYDLRDNRVRATESNQRVTAYQYDQRDRLIRVALPDPDGAGPLGAPTTRYVYNVDGSVRSEEFFDAVDPLAALQTRFDYDARGRLIHKVMSDPDGTGPLAAPEWFFHYDVMGNCTRETELVEPGTMVNSDYQFDSWGRLWRSSQQSAGVPLGETIVAYDRVGNQIQVRERIGDDAGDLAFRETDYVYDRLGRLITQIDSAPAAGMDRPTTQFIYDAADQLRFRQDPHGAWTEYRLDTLGRVIEMVEPETEEHAAPVTRMEYAVDGDLVVVIDPIGRRTEFVYDGLGQLVRRQIVSDESIAAATQYEYDLFGNMVAMFDADGNQQLTQYDALDRPVLVNANGAVTERLYDGLGRLITETDALGEVTRYRYDLLGRRTVTSPSRADGQTPVQILLDDDQAVLAGVWLTAPDGWAGSHRVADPQDASTATATWSISGLEPGSTYEVFATWHPDSQNVDHAVFQFTEDGVATTESVEVDQRRLRGDLVDGDQTWQRLARVTVVGDTLDVALSSPTADGKLIADGVWLSEVSGNTYKSYDLRGNVVAECDALGNTTHYVFDAGSRRTDIIDENGDATHFSYDLLGRLVSLTDPLGNTTHWDYDRLDRTTSEWVERDGDLSVTRYEYDVMGNLRSIVDRLGRVRSMEHDALGRLTDETWYRSLAHAADDVERLNETHRSYDAVGRLIAISDSAGTYQYVYDTLDRPVTTLVDIVATPQVVLQNEYDRHDDLRSDVVVSIEGQLDHVVSYNYDDRSRLASLQQWGPEVVDKRIDFRYSEADQLSQIKRYEDLDAVALVVQSDYEFDAHGRLVSLQHHQQDDLLTQYTWGRDATGRIVQEDASLDGTSRIVYDARGQLVSAELGNGELNAYSYDANGNRSNDQYQVGDRNLIEADGRCEYQYDAQGNRIERLDTLTGHVTRYEWDVMNRLVKVVEFQSEAGPEIRTVEYQYDAFGRRVSKIISPAIGPGAVESFVYDDDDMILRFVAGDLANRYLHGPQVDQVLADEQLTGSGAPNVVWPLSDHLGTVRDLVEYDLASDTAAIANHITYDAFGQVLNETAEAVDHIFGFTGREIDRETDLQYYRARYYDPQIGQFISEDPAGFDAGDANLRRYLENDPINRVDPTGMYGDDVHFYFNYYLARYLGLDRPSGWVNSKGKPISEALIIAYFATRVDYDKQTAPIKGGVKARRRFHTPDPDDGKGVREADNRVANALKAVGKTGDIEMFGLLLHTYQDTFAHQGFGDKLGHASQKHKPDEPFRHPVRDKRMARQTYAMMEQLLIARRGGKAKCPGLKTKSFNQFWNEVSSVMLQPPRGKGHDGSYSMRITCWRMLIDKDFRGASPQFNDSQEKSNSPLARRARQLAAKVVDWYGPSYSHRLRWQNWKPLPAPRQTSTAGPRFTPPSPPAAPKQSGNSQGGRPTGLPWDDVFGGD